LDVVSRFLIDLRLGPRTLQTACELVASVALCCGKKLPLLLMDDHLPYPAAILRVFGVIKHRRRPKARGRRRKPTLKAPPGLLVGVVKKLRDARGNLLKVSSYALFGRLEDINKRIGQLRIGRQINTSDVERLNGTMRTQQGRLSRRTRNLSKLAVTLQWSLWLWRDLYNWTRAHGSLKGCCPAMVLGLSGHIRTVLEYIRYPTHISEPQRQLWAEQRKDALESALEKYQRKKSLPTS
jgi:hypothetical protein